MGKPPRFEAELPGEIAIFPLTGALLLPGGRLPLHIFEPRYVAMVEDTLASSRMFGMIQEDRRGGEAGSLYRVGCLGRLASFSETDDGRYLITLVGLSRFEVTEELAMRRGYRRVMADYSRFAGDTDQAAPAPLPDRAGLMAALRAYFALRGFEANWNAIDQMLDEELVVTLAMVCPFEAAEKQALLEAPTPASRSQALLALLQMGAHGDQPAGGAPS